MIGPSETRIMLYILAQLNQRADMVAWRVNTGAAHDGKRFFKFGKLGHSDIFALWNVNDRAVPVFVEVKSATGRQTDSQKKFQSVVERFNACYILASSLQEVNEGLMRFKRERLDG